GEFYRETGDTASLRVHADRVAGIMRARLEHDAADVGAYEVLARALGARASLRVAGSDHAARAAAELAVSLGSTAHDTRLATEVAPPAAVDLAALGRGDHDDLLFPQPASAELRALFHHLGERMAKHVGVDLRRYGVGRAERLRRG